MSTSCERCGGKDVLEAGSGEGYGADLISTVATGVTCVDYDLSAVEHTRARYPQLTIHQANLIDLPLAAESVDMVVNFQVIEHLWDQPAFVAECLRVLRRGGELLISTPNRITFSPGRDTPLNPFHTRELNPAELRELLEDAGFTVTETLGVFHGAGMRALDAKWGGSFIDAQIERALSGQPWPQELTDDVAGVGTGRFPHHRHRPRGESRPAVRRGETLSDNALREASPVPGMFSLVLHSHLPWLANHGRWPVGEEWLYQSWAASYQPVFAALRRLAADGFTDQLTLGITPVLAAQLDDPHCLTSMYEWLADWQLRGAEAAISRTDTGSAARPTASVNDLGTREYRSAAAALVDFETHWRHGGSALIRSMIDSGTIELLGGPLAHPFAPLLDPRLRDFSLREGLSDAQLRFDTRPARDLGPGMRLRAGHGVGLPGRRGPALHGRRPGPARRHRPGPHGR